MKPKTAEKWTQKQQKMKPETAENELGTWTQKKKALTKNMRLLFIITITNNNNKKINK